MFDCVFSEILYGYFQIYNIVKLLNLENHFILVIFQIRYQRRIFLQKNASKKIKFLFINEQIVLNTILYFCQFCQFSPKKVFNFMIRMLKEFILIDQSVWVKHDKEKAFFSKRRSILFLQFECLASEINNIIIMDSVDYNVMMVSKNLWTPTVLSKIQSLVKKDFMTLPWLH